MDTNQLHTELAGWLREQVKYITQSIAELEKAQNYGKATLCEGMLEAYTQCLKKINAV
ncbi:MAG: hypothetical protein HKL88_02970 [Bacteroidia bacterium]|nr:hypothetical protein [Bacteroidia bacterium]